MDEITKADEFLAFVNKLLKDRLSSLESLNDLEKLQVKMSIYNIFEKHHDPENLYHELVDYLENEGLDVLKGDIKNYYNSLNK